MTQSHLTLAIAALMGTSIRPGPSQQHTPAL